VILAAGAGLAAQAADAQSADKQAAPGDRTTAASVRIGRPPTMPRGSEPIAAPAGSRELNLGVWLKPRSQGALDDFVQAVSTPGSAQYHRYLSKGEFAARFGPAPATIAATEDALRAEGLTVGPVSPDGLDIPVSATVASAGSAFGTGFTGYRLANGKAVYANTSAPLLPAAVAANVSGIVGLDNLATPTSNLVTSGHEVLAPANGGDHNGDDNGDDSPNAPQTTYTAPKVCSSLTTKLNNGGMHDGTQYYSPAALSSVYGLTSDLAVGDNGAGVTVGVYELETIDLTGIRDFETCLGIANPVAVEKTDGGSTTPVDASNGIGDETALDVETLAALAPGISIIDYEGPDAAHATDTNFLDNYQRMVTEDTVKVISTSWSYCELDSDSSLITSENSIFAEAAAQGQTVVSAAGDSGSTGCYGDQTGHDATLNVDDPASQPDVLSVGGTSMKGLFTPSVTAWNTSGDGQGGATGGGVSQIWALPRGSYQSGFTATGYRNGCNAPTGYACRQVPDVSALADAGSGYLTEVYASLGRQGAGEYVGINGGTSGAAPLWAAVVALADASKPCAGTSPGGLVNPVLYDAAKAGGEDTLTDVTTGNNVLSYSGYDGPNFPAAPGYDLATGLGTPLAGGVTKLLCAARASLAGNAEMDRP